MRAAIYARYSSENCSPTSIEDQISSCRRFAERNGIEILEDHIYHDDGISGARNDRTSLEALMIAAQDRCFNVVLIDDMSRLSRSTLDTLRYAAFFESVDVVIKTVGDNIDTSNEISRILLPFLGMKNEGYLKDLGQKTFRGLRGRIDEGYFVAECAFGYDTVDSIKTRPDRKGKLVPAGKMLVINELEAEVVRRIFQEFADGKSVFGIVQRLNQDGVRGRKNRTCTWGPGEVHRILRNEKYKGTRIWGRKGSKRNPLNGKVRHVEKPRSEWLVKEMPELRIVPQELWDKVHERLADVKRVWKGGKKRTGFQGATGNRVTLYPQELLSGAMVCGVCGAMIVKVTGKSGGYYGCHKAAKKGCTNRAIVKKSLAERIILGEVSKLLSNPETLSFVFRKVEQTVAKEFSKSPGSAKQKEAEYKKQVQERDNLIGFIAKGHDSKGVAEALKECEGKIERLDAELVFLNKCHTRLFKAPPKEWVAERVSKIKEVLEQKVEKSALLLRKLLGRIVAEPAETENGFRYLKVKTAFRCLSLLENEPALKNPHGLPGGVSAGSTTFRWSGRRDLNSRLRPWQGRTLPLSYARVMNVDCRRTARGLSRKPATLPLEDLPDEAEEVVEPGPRGEDQPGAEEHHSHAVDRYPQDRVMEDEGRDPDIQEQGLRLPQFRGGDDHPFRGGHPAQRRDADLPADHDDSHPRRDPARRDKHRHRGAHEQLVGQRVEQLAQGGDHVVAPRDITVEKVGDRGDDEQGEGGHRTREGDLPSRGREEDEDHHRDREDPQQRQDVGCVQAGVAGHSAAEYCRYRSITRRT